MLGQSSLVLLMVPSAWCLVLMVPSWKINWGLNLSPLNFTHFPPLIDSELSEKRIDWKTPFSYFLIHTWILKRTAMCNSTPFFAWSVCSKVWFAERKKLPRCVNLPSLPPSLDNQLKPKVSNAGGNVVSPTANGSQSGGPCAPCDTTGGERARVESAPTEHRENGMEW